MKMSKALGLAVTLALAPWAMSVARAQNASTKITVVLPNPSAVNNFPLYVAVGEKMFEKEGLDVRIEAVDGSSQVLQAMSAGQAQIGQPGPAPVLAARARGVDVVFIYNHFAKSVFGVVVPEKSAIKSPADLKGAVIGVGTADGAEVGFTRAILTDLKMSEGKDFTFLPVGDGGLAAAAFLRGDVKAYAAAVSDAAIMETRGIDLREITPEQYLSYFGNGYAAIKSFIDQNPQAVEKFGRVLVQATEFGLKPENKEKVLQHTKAGNPQEGEDTKLSAALFEQVKDRITPFDKSKGWGYQPPEHWELWHKSAVASGVLKAPLPDLKAAYTNQFVDTWNKGAK
jgi:NitT/TauT family transport system substrate-binding protein